MTETSSTRTAREAVPASTVAAAERIVLQYHTRAQTGGRQFFD